MTLEELKAMKEKTDSMLKTLQNDREVLVQAKNELIDKNTNDCMKFLSSLCEYVKLLANCEYTSNYYVNVAPVFEDFKDKDGCRVFYLDDMDLWLCRQGNAAGNYIHLICSGSSEGYIIDITTDEVFFHMNEHKHCYLENDFKKFILDRKDAVKKMVEDFVQNYFEYLTEESKKENDRLYSDIEKLDR